MTEAEQKLLEKIATEFVCPNSHQATTQYEIGYVKTLVSFAFQLKAAGYTKPETLADLKARARKRPDLIITEE